MQIFFWALGKDQRSEYKRKSLCAKGEQDGETWISASEKSSQTPNTCRTKAVSEAQSDISFVVIPERGICIWPPSQANHEETK